MPAVNIKALEIYLTIFMLIEALLISFAGMMFNE